MSDNNLHTFEEKMNRYSRYIMSFLSSFGPFIISLAPGSLLFIAVSATFDNQILGFIIALANEIAGLSSSHGAVDIYHAWVKKQVHTAKFVITIVLSSVYLFVGIGFAIFVGDEVVRIIRWAVAFMPFMMYSVYIILAFRSETLLKRAEVERDRMYQKNETRQYKRDLRQLELEEKRLQLEQKKSPEGVTLLDYLSELDPDELSRLNKSQIAKKFNVSRTTLYEKLKKINGE